MSVLQGTAFYISKRIGRAIMDYRMLDDGDKIAVAVSGGKDSLTLLHMLNERRKFVPVKYELLAVHVDMGPMYGDSRLLAGYLDTLGIPYHIEKVDTLRDVPLKEISCFWCSWNRRKALFEAADRFGCRKVALGHHKDDIIETMLLNLFFQGEISAMSPRQELFGGTIVLIRPLAYVEERLIIRYFSSLGFPYQTCDCPNAGTSNRTKMAAIISDLEKVCPDVKTNLFRSLKRIKQDYLL